jgi:hypothetical protein
MIQALVLEHDAELVEVRSQYSKVPDKMHSASINPSEHHFWDKMFGR